MLSYASDVKKLLTIENTEPQKISETRQSCDDDEPEEVQSLKKAVALMFKEDKG